jgi:hypothetical protein
VLEAVDRVGRLIAPLALRLFMTAVLWTTTPVGAVFLACGLASRLVAATLLVMAAGAGMMGAGPPELVYWLMILGQICLRGAGPLSLDELVYLRLRGLFPQLDGKPASRWPTCPTWSSLAPASSGSPRRAACAGAEPGSP